MIPQPAGDGTWIVAIDPAWPGFAGHFPGDPLLPAAELIDWALTISGTRAVTKAKFLHPVRPGDGLTLRVRGAGQVRSVSVERDGQIVARIDCSAAP